MLWPQDVALPAYAYQTGVSFVLANLEIVAWLTL
jgi:hypothetical protein